MLRINVSSVQQYTVDRLRVSLNTEYEVTRLKKLRITLTRSDGVDCTDQLMSIDASNAWEYIDEASQFDLYITTNGSLEEDTYTFQIDEPDTSFDPYVTELPLKYMEDVRIGITDFSITSLSTLKIRLHSLHGTWNTMKFWNLMGLSVMDSGDGTFYSDAFEPLADAIARKGEDPVKEVEISLRDGKFLPNGYYILRFTSRYKSRMFSIVQSPEMEIHFMTTTPPAITDAYISKRSTGDTVLSVSFSPFIEYSMLNEAIRQVVSVSGVDVTDYFEADRVSTTSYSMGGAVFITKINIPVYTKYYALKKGQYIIKWTWSNPTIPDISGTINTDWVVNSMTKLEEFRTNFLALTLPVEYTIIDYRENEKYEIEYKGNEIDPTGIFGPLTERHVAQFGTSMGDYAVTDMWAIPIEDFSQIKRGVYRVVLYHEEDGIRKYDWIESIDIIAALSPTIQYIEQTNIDILTVKLEEPRPIEALRQYTAKFLDQYGSIDYSNRFWTIEESNVWASETYETDTFDIVIDDVSTLPPGKYQFTLNYMDEDSNTVNATFKYMAKRKGFISSIEQTALNEITIAFSEPQTRQFLLSTYLIVERKIDGADFTERFELLENVLKADQSQFTSFVLPMDHEDSMPAGRYRIGFYYEKKENEIYAYDADLGFLTNNIPEISIANSEVDSTNGLMSISIDFAYRKYLEFDLYNAARFRLINKDTGEDVTENFIEKTTDNFREISEYSILTKINYTNYLNNLVNIFDDAGGYQYTLVLTKNNAVDFLYALNEDGTEKSYRIATISAWDGWGYYSTRLHENLYIRNIVIPVRDENVTVNRGTYVMTFDWPDIDYLDPVTKEIFLEYQLPEVKSIEVVDANPTTRYARLYFQIDTAMQASYFTELQVEVLDPRGRDVTEYFKTLQESNDFSLQESVDDFNLDIKRLDMITFGEYQFIFYHLGEDGIHNSHFIGRCDITAATNPRIESASQISINTIEIILKQQIPRRLLENLTFTFKKLDHTDHTDKFMTIDQANDWDDDVRWIDTFVIKIRGGYSIGMDEYVRGEYCIPGSYLFTMWNETQECDGYIFTIERLEGINGDIVGHEIRTLSSFEFEFREEESRELWKNMLVEVLDEDGKDVTSTFMDIPSCVSTINTDYFTTLPMEIMEKKHLKKGVYEFNFYKNFMRNRQKIRDDVLQNEVSLPYLSSIYPLLYTVAATKLQSDDLVGESDAVIMWFDPPLELDLYQNASFTIRGAYNHDRSFTDRFVPISEASYDSYEENGITFVEAVYLNFANNYTLNRDMYNFYFYWEGDYKYMKDLSKDIQLDYFLYMADVEQIDSTTVRMTFRKPVEKSFLRECELLVDTTYQYTNDDGTGTTEVDFSSQFKALAETNDFSGDGTAEYADFKMGTRNQPISLITITEENHEAYIGKRIAVLDQLTEENKDNYLGKVINAYDMDANEFTFLLREANYARFIGYYIEVVNEGTLDIVTLTEGNITNYYKHFEDDGSGVDIEVGEDMTVMRYSDNAEPIIPDGKYRFRVAQKITDITGNELLYAYGGTCNIKMMMSEEVLNTPATIRQVSYDTLQMFFEIYQLTNVLNNTSFQFTRPDPNNEENILSYGNRFKSIKESNYYEREVTKEIVYLRDNNIASYYGSTVQLVSSKDADIEVLTVDLYQKYINKETRIFENEKEKGYYVSIRDTDIVINQIHYELQEVPSIFLKLSKNQVLPASTYHANGLYMNKEYYDCDIKIPFMTASPPSISGMRIDTLISGVADEEQIPVLVIDFKPNAEITAVNGSSFTIQVHQGVKILEDGSIGIRGKDVSDNFLGISDGIKVTHYSDNRSMEIEYVEQIKIPLAEDAFLASGKYTITWDWPAESFFPQSTYTGGLQVVAPGVVSAMTSRYDQIEITLTDEISIKRLFAMDVTVMSSDRIDYSEAFLSIEDSNKELYSDEEIANGTTDSFFLQLDEDEVLTGDTYQFTVVANDEYDDDASETEDDEVNEPLDEDEESSAIFNWEMSLVYLASNFPEITRVDNISVEKYSVVYLTKDNASAYIGKKVQMLASSDPDQITELTTRNKKKFYGNYIRVYNDPRIDQLTFVLDDEVDYSLIAALDATILDSDSSDISKWWNSPGSSTKYNTRYVLRRLYFRLPGFEEGDELAKYDVTVMTADRTDITDRFMSLIESNGFLGTSSYNHFYLDILYDEVIEQKDIWDEDREVLTLRIIVRDGDGQQVYGYTVDPQFRQIRTTKYIDMNLKSGHTIIPSAHTYSMEYYNEPDLEDAIVISPFGTNSVDFPFLSTDLGTITYAEASDLQTLKFTFSNLNFPVMMMRYIQFVLVNEDDDPVDADFEPLSDTNDFDGLATLQDLDEPGVVYVQLEPNSYLESGYYTAQWWIPLQTNADLISAQSENDDEDDDDEDAINRHISDYCLWTKSCSLPYMYRESANNISSVEVIAHDKLLVKMENPVEMTLLRNFSFDIYSPVRKETTYDEFYPLNQSNFFGMYIMPCDNRYICYSMDSMYWYRFDTGRSYTFTKTFYHEKSKNYYILCTNGRILRFDDLNKSFLTETDPTTTIVNYLYGTQKYVTKSLNDYAFIDTNTIVIVGNGGTILRGTINAKGVLSLDKVNSPTDRNLTSVISFTLPGSSDVVLVSVGYRGTCIISYDQGYSWTEVKTGVRNNLSDVAYFFNTIQVEGEDPDVDFDSDEDTDFDPEISDSEKALPEMTLIRAGIVVVGTSGTILYAPMIDSFADGTITDSYQYPTAMQFTSSDNVDGQSSFETIDYPLFDADGDDDNTITKQNLYTVTTKGRYVVIGGDNGTIIRFMDTTDGFDPDVADVPATFAIRDIKWCDGRYVAAGSSGKWLTSASGLKWSVNSSTTSSAFKAVDYIDNQYHATSADWFYVKVRPNAKVAGVNVYEGYDVPTENESMKIRVGSWSSTDEKLKHDGDIYRQLIADKEMSRILYLKYWQYTAVYDTDLSDVDEDELDSYEIEYTFEWKEITETILQKTLAFNGKYFGRLRPTRNDPSEYIYSTKETFEVPYLTGNPGTISSVTFHSPDDEDSVSFKYPYLHVKIDNLDEIAFLYANYDFLNSQGNSYTSVFNSLHLCDFSYNKSSIVDGIYIFGKENILSNLPTGNYYLKWCWMAMASSHELFDDYINFPDVPDGEEGVYIKNITPLVTEIKRVSGTEIKVSFKSKTFPKNYVVADSQGKLNMNMNIRRLPEEGESDPSDVYDYKDINAVEEINYYYNFKIPAVTDSEDYSVVTLDTTGEYIDNINLRVNDNAFVRAGTYLFKLSNSDFEHDIVPYEEAVKETNTVLGYTATKFELLSGLDKTQPSISNVSLENWGKTPTTTDGEEHNTLPFYGTKSPTDDSTMLEEMDTWTSDATKNYYVGSKYSNTSNNTVYYYTKNGDSYSWEQWIPKPHLMITFQDMPIYKNFMNEFVAFELNNVKKYDNEYMIENFTSSETNLKFTTKNGKAGTYFNDGGLLYWDGTDAFYTDNPGGESYYTSKIGHAVDKDGKTIETTKPLYLKRDSMHNWEFITVGDDNDDSNPKRIHKIYIPLIDGRSFPGSDCAELIMHFEKDFNLESQTAFYRSCSLSNFQLGYTVGNYGSIKSIDSFNPKLVYTDSDNKIWDNMAGLKIKLSRKLSWDFLHKLDFTITRNKEDFAYKFKSISASHSATATDDEDDMTDTFMLLLESGEMLDHGRYTLKLKGDPDKMDLYSEGMEGIETKIISYSKKFSTPWITTNRPKTMTATLTPGKGAHNPYLTLKFSTANYPVLSDILKEKGDGIVTSNADIKVTYHGEDVSKRFRGITAKSTVIKTTDDHYGSSVSTEKFVTSITMYAKNAQGFKKGTYVVSIRFGAGSKMLGVDGKRNYMPNTTLSGKCTCKFTENQISRIGYFTEVKCPGHVGDNATYMECKFQMESSINTDKKLAKSSIGKDLGFTTWNKLLKKLKFTMVKSKKSYQSQFNSKTISTKKKIVKLRIKKNKVVHPGKFKFGMKYGSNDQYPIVQKTLWFPGLIWNKVGYNRKYTTMDKGWMVYEKSPNGKRKSRFYQKYKTAMARVDKLKKLNSIRDIQWRICKQCRKIKLLTTKKYKNAMDGYEFIYTKHKDEKAEVGSGTYKFFNQLMKKWYKYRTKDAKSAPYKVAVTFTGKQVKWNKTKKIYELIKDEKNPTKKYTYKCNSKPFPGFDWELYVEQTGDEHRISMCCDNYVKKGTKYTYSMKILSHNYGTANGKNGKRKGYFVTLTWKSADLTCAFKSGKKGKKSKKYKKYVKWLRKKVKKQKKKIKKCKACRKKAIVYRNNKGFGWNACLFPIRVSTLKRMKGLPASLNIKNKYGGFKKQKKPKKKRKTNKKPSSKKKKKLKKKKTKVTTKSRWGCKKPNFVWTTGTYKKTKYTKLKCKNAAAPDNTLKVSTFQTYCYKK